MREAVEQLPVHLRQARPLFGEAQNVLLSFRIGRALFKTGEVCNLFRRESSLLTEGRVIVQSVMTIVDLRSLQVSEFAQFGIEAGADRFPHRHYRLQHLGSMCQRPIHIWHVADGMAKCLKRFPNLFARLLVGNWLEDGHLRPSSNSF